MKRSVLLFLCLLIHILPLNAKEIKVGLEPFPPLINEDGSGILIDMLNTITKTNELTFNVQLMTYARAKRDLQNQRLDLIGLTPQQHETEEFYSFADELDWSIDTTLDIFSFQQPPFDVKRFADHRIGTLIGNAEFFAELLTLPASKFIEVSSLPQLVKMLEKGRISAIIFERMSTMSTIKQLKIAKINYQKLTQLPASLAVQNNRRGRLLKQQLEPLLTAINISLYSDTLGQYQSLKSYGQVPVEMQ